MLVILVYVVFALAVSSQAEREVIQRQFMRQQTRLPFVDEGQRLANARLFLSSLATLSARRLAREGLGDGRPEDLVVAVFDDNPALHRQAFKCRFHLRDGKLRDTEGRPVDVDLVSREVGQAVRIWSVGPDGRVGTDDDLVLIGESR